MKELLGVKQRRKSCYCVPLPADQLEQTFSLTLHFNQKSAAERPKPYRNLGGTDAKHFFKDDNFNHLESSPQQSFL